jgi:hypothetical protein
MNDGARLTPTANVQPKASVPWLHILYRMAGLRGFTDLGIGPEIGIETVTDRADFTLRITDR